jgi:hypothetical protein
MKVMKTIKGSKSTAATLFGKGKKLNEHKS